MQSRFLFRVLFDIRGPIVLGLVLGLRLAAQDALRGWGGYRFDTDAYSLPAIDIVANDSVSAVLRADGRIFVHGYTVMPDGPPAPPGTGYTQIAITRDQYPTGYGFGLLTTGSILSWGHNGTSLPAPALPPNTTYVQVSAGYDHAVARRSDGLAVAWGGNLYGQSTLPAVPPSVAVMQVQAGDVYSLLLLSNGTIIGCGIASMAVVPALPPGVTYTDLRGGAFHALARRSDGGIVAWGDNSAGQCNVPALPAGVTYATMGLGAMHSVAARSDGTVVAWGDNSSGQCNVPTLPVGATVAQIVGGRSHSAIRFTNGVVIAFGEAGVVRPQPPAPAGERWIAVGAGFPTLGLSSGGTVTPLGVDPSVVPALWPGLSYVDVVVGYGHCVALRSDGRAVAWGLNDRGQCTIPALLPPFAYTAVSASFGRTVLLRSDGGAVECGNYGAITIPPPPPGVRYEDVSCQYDGTLLLRSDGAVVAVNTSGPPAVLSPPPSTRYTAVARARICNAALRSDGLVEVWGGTLVTLPPLPPGVSYVELAAGDTVLVARRSDGTIVGAGTDLIPDVPVLGPGESFVEISANANYDLGTARVGPTCTYVSFGAGCGGTRPASRLVPRDTPRIGRSLEVTVFDLPHSLAVMVFGWNRIAPVPLAAFGMPGCALHTTIDATVALLGQNGQAQFFLPIPNAISLVGVSFANQAIVFDPAANPAGLVASNAAEGVIGHR